MLLEEVGLSGREVRGLQVVGRLSAWPVGMVGSRSGSPVVHGYSARSDSRDNMCCL